MSFCTSTNRTARGSHTWKNAAWEPNVTRRLTCNGVSSDVAMANAMTTKTVRDDVDGAIGRPNHDRLRRCAPGRAPESAPDGVGRRDCRRPAGWPRAAPLHPRDIMVSLASKLPRGCHREWRTRGVTEVSEESSNRDPAQYPTDDHGWRRLEFEQKERGLAEARIAAKRQLWATGIAAITVLAAIAGTILTYRSSQAASDAAIRQQKGDVLAAAISALGGAKPAERIAGLSLLVGLAGDSLIEAQESGVNEDALAAKTQYRNAVTTVLNYLREPPNPNFNTQYAPATLGYGFPKVQPENQYAANALRELLRMSTDPRYGIVDVPGVVAIDLSTTQLYGQSWQGVDFSHTSSTYINSADLRGTNLKDSRFPNATLTGTFFTCANFENADLTNADLSFTDLRGANLRGSTLTQARGVATARLDGAIMPDDRSAPYDKQGCLNRQRGELPPG